MLAPTLAEIAVRFALRRLRHGGPLPALERARWLHASCSAIVRRLRLRTQVRGTPPAAGLLCSNHLSYLDILVFAAAMPCVFVSKSEVSAWPVFGFFARAAGTLFIDRSSRLSTELVAEQMSEALAAGIPVLLFPEGTSTDGSSVLRFHPSLLEPAVRLAAPVTAAAIAYRARNVAERDLCWFGDAGFLPHLLRTLGRGRLAADLDFHPDRVAYPDRKSAALDLHAKVEALRHRMNAPGFS